MKVGVIVLVGGVEFLNFVLFQDCFQKLLGLDHVFDVLVLDLALVGVLLAAGDTVCHFE